MANRRCTNERIQEDKSRLGDDERVRTLGRRCHEGNSPKTNIRQLPRYQRSSVLKGRNIYSYPSLDVVSIPEKHTCLCKPCTIPTHKSNLSEFLFITFMSW